MLIIVLLDVDLMFICLMVMYYNLLSSVLIVKKSYWIYINVNLVVKNVWVVLVDVIIVLIKVLIELILG